MKSHLHGFEEPPDFVPHVCESGVSQFTGRENIVVVKPGIILRCLGAVSNLQYAGPNAEGRLEAVDEVQL